MALETKKLVEQRVVSKQEFAASKRKVAKSKALWANICREIESQRNLLEEEVAGIEMTMREINATRSTQSEIGMRLLKLQAESRSVHESYAWGREFQKQTIDPLEQRLAQSEGDTTAEKKSESPREPVASE